MFVSLADGSLSPEQFEIMKSAYAKAAVQKDTLIPLDWETNKVPADWLINGEEKHFDWNYNEQ